MPWLWRQGRDMYMYIISENSESKSRHKARSTGRESISGEEGLQSHLELIKVGRTTQAPLQKMFLRGGNGWDQWMLGTFNGKSTVRGILSVCVDVCV